MKFLQTIRDYLAKADSWWATIADKLPFNPGKRKVQLGVALFLLLLIAALATTCRAAPAPYVSFGGGSTVVRGESAVADLAVTFPRRVGESDVRVSVTLVGESTTPAGAQRNNFGASLELVDGVGNVDLGFGLVYLQNTDTYNGSNLNFVLSVGYRLQSLPLTVGFKHWSNAGTRMPNKGRDMVFVSYRFRGDR